MSVVVRVITHEDFDAVTGLLAELGRPALTQETLTAVRAAYHTHVNNPRTFSLIAEVDGQAAGFISLELRHRLNWGTLEAWIPDFIVTEGARGTGVGHALFEQAIEIARENNCHRIALESGYSRGVAHKFYEQHGMTNSGYYFVMAG